MAWIDYQKAKNMVPQTWIIDCLKMNNISKVISFITEGTNDIKVELTGGCKTLAEIKIQKGIFQRNSFAPVLIVIAMTPLSYINRKGNWGYKFTKSKETNYLLSIHIRHQAICKRRKKKWTLWYITIRIYSEYIGKECTRLIMKSEKRKIKEEIEMSNQERIRMFKKKENYLGVLKEEIIKQTSNWIGEVRKTTKTRKPKREEKPTYRDFKRQIYEIALDKTWTRLWKGNF